LLILGIDPGIHVVGYGLVKMESRHFSAVDYGFLPTDETLAFPQRLKQIYDAVSELLNRCQPDVVVVEEVFVSQNAKTTLKLGHARGVILLAAMERNLPIAEYAPREVKQAVLGKGGASKRQVQWMMAQMLHLKEEKLQEDAADGLAVALCHGLRSCKSPSEIY